MKIFSYLNFLLSILYAHFPYQENPITNKVFVTNSSIFINFGTANYELDGIFEIQMKNGLFIEFWGNSQLDTNTTLNTSIGLMNEISPRLIMGGGYSNYIELSNPNNHEFFFGGSIESFTGVGFITIGNDLYSSFLGIIDLNTFLLLSQLPFDLSISGLASKELDNNGYDFFINFSKTFKSGFSFGYSFSRERYEDQQTRTFTFIKQGQTITKTRTIPIAKQGFFNTVSLGITF